MNTYQDLKYLSPGGRLTSARRFLGVVLSTLLLGPISLTAQKKGYSNGYIISREGDTIEGFVKDRDPEPFESLYSKIRFKKKGKLKKKYSPDEIRGYGYLDAHFESVNLKEENQLFRIEYRSDPHVQPMFLKVIDRTPNLVLYAWEYEECDSSYIESFPIFYRPDRDTWVRATQGIFGLKRKKLVPFFLDCPLLALGIQNKTINTVSDILEVYGTSCFGTHP